MKTILRNAMTEVTRMIRMTNRATKAVSRLRDPTSWVHETACLERIKANKTRQESNLSK